MTAERWLPVPTYEGKYEVSDLGRVRSLSRVTSHGRRRRGLVLRPIPRTTGYLQVDLWHDNTQRAFVIHRLVLWAFVGPAPAGLEALHGDGDPTNNALTNLRWGTRSENSLDQVAHGTHASTSKTHCPAEHPYDEANTYVYPRSGARACRTCRRANSSKNYQARKANLT